MTLLCDLPAACLSKNKKVQKPLPLNKVPFVPISTQMFCLVFLKSLLMFVHLHVVILPPNVEVPAQTVGA